MLILQSNQGTISWFLNVLLPQNIKFESMSHLRIIIVIGSFNYGIGTLVPTHNESQDAIWVSLSSERIESAREKQHVILWWTTQSNSRHARSGTSYNEIAFDSLAKGSNGEVWRGRLYRHSEWIRLSWQSRRYDAKAWVRLNCSTRIMKMMRNGSRMRQNSWCAYDTNVSYVSLEPESLMVIDL